VAGFYFLRLMCPAITNPHVYGLQREPPDEVSQRYLILLSKVLQNIANGTLPGNKEKYMESLNEFIQSHLDNAVQFFERLAAKPKEAPSKDIAPVPDNVYFNALLYLATHIQTIQSRIDRTLNEATEDKFQNAQEMKLKLHEIVDKVAAKRNA